jgi:hypothetical protein
MPRKKGIPFKVYTLIWKHCTFDQQHIAFFPNETLEKMDFCNMHPYPDMYNTSRVQWIYTLDKNGHGHVVVPLQKRR